MSNTMSLAAGWVVVSFTGLVGLTIVALIWLDKIKLYKLISEPNGDASLSRLQFLIFTFVISLSLFLVIVGQKPPAFPATIPTEILTLLGISGSSYLVSKAIQFSSPAGVAHAALVISPPTADQPAVGAAVPPFTVSAVNIPAGSAIPHLTWSIEAPALGRIDPIPPNQAQYTGPPAPSPGAGTKVTIRVRAQGFEDGTAVVTLA